MQALERFGAPLARLGIAEADFVSLGTVVQLGVPPVRIALITELSVKCVSLLGCLFKVCVLGPRS